MARYVRKLTKPLACLFALLALGVLNLQLLARQLFTTEHTSINVRPIIQNLLSAPPNDIKNLAWVHSLTELPQLHHDVQALSLWHPGMIRNTNETLSKETLQLCQIQGNRRLLQNRVVDFKQIKEGNLYVPLRDILVARSRYKGNLVDPKYNIPNLTSIEMKAISQQIRENLREHAQIISTALVNYSRDEPPSIFTYFEPEVFRLIPPEDQLIPDRKNPCFHTNARKGQTFCLPYVYLGGAPKCAHPDVISRSKVKKEPHFWTRGQHKEDQVLSYLQILSISQGNIRDLNWWRKVKVGVDASVCTLWDNRRVAHYLGNPPEGPPIILADILRAVQPYAKFIFILRNPTERLYSEYLHLDDIWRFAGVKSQKDFHDRVQNIIRVFDQCLLKNSFRHCASRYYAPRINIGMYSVYLREWFHRFPRDQILILRTETWGANLEREYKRVCDFLKLSELSEEKFKEITNLENSRIRTGEDKDLGPMFTETEKLLDKFYEPFNQDLVDLLNDEDYLWSDRGNHL